MLHHFNSKASVPVLFFSRLIDYSLLFLFGVGISLALPCEVSGWFYLIWALATPLAWVPLHAFLLSTWGTTPGKACFRCKVRCSIGFRLGLKAAFKRAIGIGSAPGEMIQRKISSLRRFLAYTLSVTAVLFSLFCKQLTDYSIGMQKQQTTAGWVHYFAKEGGFQVDFPNDPQIEEKEIEVPSADKPVNYNEYSSKDHPKISYAVSYIDLPKKYGFVSSKRILKGVFDVMIKAEPTSSILFKDHSSHKTFGALDYKLKKGEEEIIGRLIRVGKRIYKLTVTYPPNVKDKLLDKEFINSFDLENA